MFYLLLEKDKMLRDKDQVINELKEKIEGIKINDLLSIVPSSSVPVSHSVPHKHGFVDVNA